MLIKYREMSSMLFVLYALIIWGKKLEVVSTAAATPIIDIKMSGDRACFSSGTNICLIFLSELIKTVPC
jgi:hypothetical protein